MDMCTFSRLSVGGNDLAYAGHSLTLLVDMRINEFAQELVIVGITRVVVCGRWCEVRVGSTQCARRVRPE